MAWPVSASPPMPEAPPPAKCESTQVTLGEQRCGEASQVAVAESVGEGSGQGGTARACTPTRARARRWVVGESSCVHPCPALHVFERWLSSSSRVPVSSSSSSSTSLSRRHRHLDVSPPGQGCPRAPGCGRAVGGSVLLDLSKPTPRAHRGCAPARDPPIARSGSGPRRSAHQMALKLEALVREEVVAVEVSLQPKLLVQVQEGVVLQHTW